MRSIPSQGVTNACADPSDPQFDPLKTASLNARWWQSDEAFWLVFLAVHFAEHAEDGWRLCRDVYTGPGGRNWNWARVSSDVAGFRNWLATLADDGVARRFGNHRKYESLDAYSDTGTGAVVESYVRWVAEYQTHRKLVEHALKQGGGCAGGAFHWLYKSMQAVKRFGRTARFEYLTTVGNLGLAAIEPRSAYLTGAAGPLTGAKLLFGATSTGRQLDRLVVQLSDHLGMGVQVLEDALCNWQKHPAALESCHRRSTCDCASR
jgi:hypothetical protein